MTCPLSVTFFQTFSLFESCLSLSVCLLSRCHTSNLGFCVWLKSHSHCMSAWITDTCIYAWTHAYMHGLMHICMDSWICTHSLNFERSLKQHCLPTSLVLDYCVHYLSMYLCLCVYFLSAFVKDLAVATVQHVIACWVSICIEHAHWVTNCRQMIMMAVDECCRWVRS